MTPRSARLAEGSGKHGAYLAGTDFVLVFAAARRFTQRLADEFPGGGSHRPLLGFGHHAQRGDARLAIAQHEANGGDLRQFSTLPTMKPPGLTGSAESAKN